MNASTTSVTLAGLDGNTTYDVRVKANCGATSSAWTTGQFTIDCQNSIQASIDRTIGDGSTTNSYLPFYGTYNYTYSQQIYDAAELNIPAGPITEISFYCTTAPTSTTTGNIRIWMANTTKSTFADNTDYIDPSTLTQVAYVEGNRPFTTGWNTFTLSQPFMYDGTSNLVVAYYEGYDTWNGGSFWAQSTTDNKSISHYSDTYSAVSYSDPANASGSKYFNKYRSDIKLVGVRPLSQQYFNLYSEDLQQLRIKTKPGLLPPFYVDMPETLDEIQDSEHRYLEAYLKHPFRTDWKYFWKIVGNIVFKGKRSK